MVNQGLAAHAHKAGPAPDAEVLPPFGVKCVKNAARSLEDAFAVAVCRAAPGDGPGGTATAATGGSSSSTSGRPPTSPGALGFFGVFDGHGGAEAAQHAAARLHALFSQALATQQQRAAALLESTSSDGGSTVSAASSAEAAADAALAEAWAGGDASSEATSCCSMELDGTPRSSAGGGGGGALARRRGAGIPEAAVSGGGGGGGSPAPAGGGCWASSVRAMAPLADRFSEHVRRALAAAFVATDAELAGTEVGELVGTTAVVVAVSRSEVFVAHCGDSRAVLCRKGVAIPLTCDHKPQRSDELARISALGGKVVQKGGGHRVMGLLAMSRAIGDHLLRPFIIPDPEVSSLQRTNDDELLLLASDGLWDVFSCQEAATLALRSTLRARERGASPSAACRVGASVLTRGAIERGSRDNVTVVVVDLRRAESAGSIAAVLAAQCSDAMLPLPLIRRKRSSSGGGGEDDDGGCGGGAGSGAADAGSDAAAAAAIAAGGCGRRPHAPAAAPPRSSHVAALASTWAGAAAAVCGGSRSGSGGGRGAAGAAPRAEPAAAGSSPSASAAADAIAKQLRLQAMQSAPLYRGACHGAPAPCGSARVASAEAEAAAGCPPPPPRHSSVRSRSCSSIDIAPLGGAATRPPPAAAAAPAVGCSSIHDRPPLPPSAHANPMQAHAQQRPQQQQQRRQC